LFSIKYKNIEGSEITLGQAAPFLVSSKKGFGAVENAITSQQQYGLDGEVVVGQRLESRDIEIDGEILAPDDATLQQLRREMSSVFNPKLAGTLIYTVDNNSYSIDVVVEKAPTLDDPQTNTALKYSIQLKAADPFWIDNSKASKLIQLSAVNKAFKFPLGITSTFIFAGITSGNIKEIDNSGDMAIGFKLTLRLIGIATNIKVLNIETQEYFGFEGTFASGTVLFANSIRGEKQMTQTVDGITTNAMSVRMDGSTFLQIAKGSNFFQIQADEGVENVIGEIQFSPVVLGV
jgi:hypothetical protein